MSSSILALSPAQVSPAPHTRVLRNSSRTHVTSLIASVSAAFFLLNGCSTTSFTKQQVGTATGAVVGGVVGSAVTGGSTAGTVAGAAGGALLGNHIGKQMDKVK
jgi:osmotically inducible lipoprotein OsmB